MSAPSGEFAVLCYTFCGPTGVVLLRSPPAGWIGKVLVVFIDVSGSVKRIFKTYRQVIGQLLHEFGVTEALPPLPMPDGNTPLCDALATPGSLIEANPGWVVTKVAVTDGGDNCSTVLPDGSAGPDAVGQSGGTNLAYCTAEQRVEYVALTTHKYQVTLLVVIGAGLRGLVDNYAKASKDLTLAYVPIDKEDRRAVSTAAIKETLRGAVSNVTGTATRRFRKPKLFAAPFDEDIQMPSSTTQEAAYVQAAIAMVPAPQATVPPPQATVPSDVIKAAALASSNTSSTAWKRGQDPKIVADAVVRILAQAQAQAAKDKRTAIKPGELIAKLSKTKDTFKDLKRPINATFFCLAKTKFKDTKSGSEKVWLKGLPTSPASYTINA